jgi:hypothetical protein
VIPLAVGSTRAARRVRVGHSPGTSPWGHRLPAPVGVGSAVRPVCRTEAVTSGTGVGCRPKRARCRERWLTAAESRARRRSVAACRRGDRCWPARSPAVAGRAAAAVRVRATGQGRAVPGRAVPGRAAPGRAAPGQGPAVPDWGRAAPAQATAQVRVVPGRARVGWARVGRARVRAWEPGEPASGTGSVAGRDRPVPARAGTGSAAAGPGPAAPSATARRAAAAAQAWVAARAEAAAAAVAGARAVPVPVPVPVRASAHWARARPVMARRARAGLVGAGLAGVHSVRDR